jgi:hypothetical protein
MKCPHCLTDFHDHEEQVIFGQDEKGYWGAAVERCSACKRIIVHLINGEPTMSGEKHLLRDIKVRRLVYPKGIARKPPSPDVKLKAAGKPLVK